MKVPKRIEEVNIFCPGITLPAPFQNKIPEQLKDLNRWAAWEYFWDETSQKWEMAFFNPQKGIEADPEDLKSLMSYDDALKFHNKWIHTAAFALNHLKMKMTNPKKH